MPSGFRRSLARHGGRSVTALLIVGTLGSGGSGQLAPGVVPRATGSDSSGPASRIVSMPRSGMFGDRTTAADVARFERTSEVAGGLSDAPAIDAAPAADAPDSAGLQPSIQYEDTVRHARDRIAFTPGGRVTVGFSPRPGDAWSVGGHAPTVLPAGRLDGGRIRAQGGKREVTGRDPAKPEAGAIDETPDPSVDLPGDDGTGVPATSASAILPGADSAPSADARVSPTGLRKEIFGFLPYWELNSSSLRLDYAKISTIAFFGVGVDGSGNLEKRNSDGSLSVGWSGWTSSRMTSIISAAHRTHTRVVLTVQSFGWSTAGLNRQKALLGSASRRLILARQIAAAVRDRGVDGVNLDFEPLASGYDGAFTALVRTIRSELNRIHSGYQITFDTLGSIGNYPIENATAPGGADAIFIMGYDYRTAGSDPVGSIAPVERPGYGIRDTILAYRARVAPSKLILGVPYYGRAWSTASDAFHAANTSGTRNGASTTVLYETAADYLAEHGRRFDSLEAVAWTAYRRQNCTSTYGCVTSWRQLYVDDAAAIGAKYDLVNAYGLRGAGIWALGYDGSRPELWAAIQRKFVTDTTPPSAGIVSLPARQTNPTFGVSWAGRDDVGVKTYDVQASTDGGAWRNWRMATTATGATWAGFDDHTYAFRVRARDLKGNVGAWNVASTSVATTGLRSGGFATVLIDGLTIRTAADTAAPKVGSYRRGAVVAIVGGPVAADGYTWLKVTGPLSEWGPVGQTTTAWIASSGGRVGATKAPNATRVAAALGDLSFDGAGAASVGSGPGAVAHRAFSPNGDGSRDTIRIDWTADRAFAALRLGVFRADGSTVGSVPVPQLGSGHHAFAWDGRVGGRPLPDGRYLVSLAGSAGGSTFANPGTTFRATALTLYGVTIDRVAPVVTGSSSTGSLISPNGDGTLDGIGLALTSTGATGWTFAAAPVSGSTVGASVTTRTGAGPAARVTWNGRSNGGSVVADGTYRLRLSAVDAAGNRATRSWTVRVDATAAALASRAEPASISPDGDGTADSTRIAWAASERISGLIRIRHGSTTIRSWTVSGATSGAIRWTGTDAAGRRVPEGTYTVQLVAQDGAGNRSARAIAIVVDRTLGGLRWSRSSFFPQDGDAITPTARVSFVLRRAARVNVGIYSGSKLVRTVWTDRAAAAGPLGWTWDGRDGSGALVARGAYEARVTVRSWVGTTVLSRSILVDAFRTTFSSTSLRPGQAVTITVTATEALRAGPSVSLSQPGHALVTRTATSIGSGVYRVSFRIATGSPGSATVKIVGRDSGGGLNTSLRTIAIR